MNRFLFVSYKNCNLLNIFLYITIELIFLFHILFFAYSYALKEENTISNRRHHPEEMFHLNVSSLVQLQLIQDFEFLHRKIQIDIFHCVWNLETVQYAHHWSAAYKIQVHGKSLLVLLHFESI